METQKDLKKGRKNRSFLWPVVFAAGLLLVLCLVLMLIAFNPGPYTPVLPENPQLVSPYLTHRLGPAFYNQIQLDKPFELIVDQAGLNDIFSRYPWPLSMDGVSVSMPVMVFLPPQVILMTQIEYKGFSAVLSVAGTPSVNEEGMNLNIQSVTLGALPITTLAQHLAEKYVAENFFPPGADGTDPVATMIFSILTNRSFDPIFTISGSAVRVTHIAIEPARARLLLTPLHGHTGNL